MKYTSLFSAVAVAAAMGTQAFGTPTAVNTDDFEASAGYEVGSVTNAANTTAWAAKHWTFEGDENDCEIVAGDVTTTGSDSQSLKLGTNGGLASFAAQTTKDYAATVSMKVRMVASDSPVDMSSDTTTQTALYLETTGDGDEATYALKAFAYDNDGGSNTWVTLAAEGFAITNDNYDAQVSIVINYNEGGSAVYTVNGTTFPAVALANPNTWGSDKRLNSVAFKGTGFVDDLFVGHEQVGTFATFAYETILDGTTTVKDPGTSVNLDGAAWTTDGYGDVAEAVTGYEYTLKLYSRENGTDTDLNVTLTADAQGQWTVNSSTYASFAEGGTYVVKAEYTLKSSTVTVVYVEDATTNVLTTATQDWFTSWTLSGLPTGATYDGWRLDGEEQYDEVEIPSLEADAYIVELLNYTAGGAEPTVYTAVTTIAAGSLEFTAFDPVARTASFTFDAAEGYEPVQGDTLATLGVVVANTLDGTQTVVGDVTFSVTEGVGSGTVTLPAAASGETSLFLFGLGDKAATPAAGE